MWRSITFCLVVDNFGIKVMNMADFKHLKMALVEHYTIAVNYEGSLFCGIKLMWDYARCHVDCSMPGYIATALKKYQHETPTVPQNAPCNIRNSTMSLTTLVLCIFYLSNMLLRS
jgi:hypothetical protein